MRKILLFLVFLSMTFLVNAQSDNIALAKQLVTKNVAAIGLSQDDANNYIVSSSYFNQTAGTQMVYLLQGYKGLPVWNQMLVLAFKDGKLISKAGDFLPNMGVLTGFSGTSPGITPSDAVRASINDAKLAMPPSVSIRATLESGKKFDFGTLGIAKENITVQLMWVPVIENAKITAIKLAWQVELYPTANADYWSIRVDATTNSVIDKNNLTVYENFPGSSNQYLSRKSILFWDPATAENQQVSGVNSPTYLLPPVQNSPTQPYSPTLVNTANYTVIPYPAEAPSFPGGTAAVRTNPWTLAGGLATTFRWHNDGVTDYTTSRGNNVHAHEDQAANNSNAGIMAISTTTPDPLNFTYAGQPNYTVPPTTPAFQQFAITQLFYWNNIMHDIVYKYGFDEVSGNFQNNNQALGGLGSDYVQADAQDGSGTNNANFATPVDGQRPRMQMYLFNPASGILTFVVNSPASIAGPYTAIEGAMSPNNLLGNVGPRTANLVWFNDDAAGTTHYACNPAANAAALNGKIALINRGFGGAICTVAVNFTTKVLNAQAAGAIGVVMVNNVPGPPIVMGGGPDPTIVTPAIMISDVDGATIAAQLSNPFVNVTMSSTPPGTVQLDGDIDNGVVSHEFFHGVSNRLTGGPANSSCLGNAEEGGEGWGDINALFLTTDWSTALITDGFNKKRPLGTYAFGQAPTGGGIRLYPYCTNIAINPLTYANMGVAPVGTEVHNIGEIWCMALWEMTWQIIQTDGINPNLFNNAAAGGNSVAYKLIIEGMRLQPCSPGYIDARNAILQADLNLYAGAHTCSIWTAFAKRGMGFSASQGSSNSATDQTPAFDLPPGAAFTTQPSNTTTCAGSTASFTAIAAGATYQWQVSTTGCGGTFTNITNGGVYSGATTSTLTITGATIGMNGYAYRAVGTTLCGNSNSNCAVLTVVAAAVGGTVTPANTSVCSTPNSTLLTLTGNVGPVSQWESSTVGCAGPWTPIAGTAGQQTYTATNVAVTTYYHAFISAAGCASASSSCATITATAGALPMFIVADPGTTVCAGDPTRLTVMEGAGVVTVCASQSSSTAITPLNSVSCNNGIGHTDNSYWRVYDLSAYPAITSNYTITSVKFGIEQASGGPQNVIANVYLQTGAAFPGGTRTLIASQTVSVANQAGTIVTATFAVPPAPVSNTSTIVVELFTPDGQATGHLFFIGSNAAAQTGLSYLSAAACGVANPTSTAAIGFPNMHIILDICGTIQTGGIVTGGTFLWSPAAGLSSTTTNPVAASPAVTTTYTVQHNNGAGCIRTAQITINVNDRPKVTVQPSSTSTCNGSGATFTATATGTGLTYQWQVSTTGAGGPWTNLTNGTPYSNVTTPTLNVSPVTAAMNGYQYRLVVSGTCAPGLGNPNISNPAILTVLALPTVSITPPGPVCGGLPGINGVALTTGGVSLPPIPGSVTVNSGTINVAIPEGAFPNPPATAGTSTLAVAGIPANATITNISVKSNITHAYVGDVIMVLKAANGAILNLDAVLNKTNNAGANFVNTIISSSGVTTLDNGIAPGFTGTFKADAVGATFPFLTFTLAGGPVGYTPTTQVWNTLYPSPNGSWTLAMYDAGAPDVGNLTSWEIKIDYTTPNPAAPVTYVWTPPGGLYSDPSATIPYVAGASAATVYAAPSAGTIYTVTATDGATGCSNTASVIVNATPFPPTVTPNPVTMCLGDVPVKLKSVSSVPGTCTVNSGAMNLLIQDANAANTQNFATVATQAVSCIPAGATVTGISVTMSIPDHTFVGDLSINLKSPNGTVLNLYRNLGATAGAAIPYPNNGISNLTISSAGITALSSANSAAQTGPVTGTYRADIINGAITPGYTLGDPPGYPSTATSWTSMYTGANGTWTLAMTDDGTGDVGHLITWSIKFDYSIGVATSAASWSPAGGLFSNAGGTIPYILGTLVDSVWAQPTPAGVYNYNVTVTAPGLVLTPSFSNTNAITIPDSGPASAYPATIAVSGLPTTGVTVKSVTLNNMNHTWTSDLDIVLQHPDGAQNVILLSDAAGGNDLVNSTITFDDAGAVFPQAVTPIPGGTYKPTNVGVPDTWPAPGPATVNQATPTLASFTGNMNGTWKLYMNDQAAGDAGNVNGGYTITFAYPTPGCTSPARVVTVTVNTPVTVTSVSADQVICTDKVATFTVVAAGTSPTYQWQVSTDNGNTYNNIANGGVYSGVTTATLTITNPPVSMNGYFYRAVVTGAAPCGSVNFPARKLTVNPLPTIVISASPNTALYPGLFTTLTSTVSPVAAATYTWLRNGVGVAGATTGTLNLDVDGLGEYQLRVTDVNGCTNLSNKITIRDSVTTNCFLYPNPSNGKFQVRYYSVQGNVLPRTVTVYDSRGTRVFSQGFTVTAPYARMDVDLRAMGHGVYWVEIGDLNGNRLSVCRAVVQ